jgi:hypothetical protein
MNKHTATCPDGSTVKRNSKNRTYSHVAVIKNVRCNQWIVIGWSSTAELARKNVASKKSTIDSYIKNGWYTGIYGDKPEFAVLEAVVA